MMAGAVRNRTEVDGYTRRAGARRRRGSLLRRAFLVVLGVVLVWFFWTTRDNWSMGGLIPAGQSFEIYANDLLADRRDIVDSRVWELFPGDSAPAGFRDALADSFGLPDWMLNNLVYGLTHLSGNSLTDAEDALVITRITRIGCLLERMHGLLLDIDDDYAGGLHLRHVKDVDVYYALRGRVLLASRSRPVLVRALTLRPEEAIGEEALERSVEAGRGRSLLAVLRPGAGEPGGEVLEEIEALFALSKEAAQLEVRARPRAAWRAPLDSLFGAGPSPALPTPPKGIVEISGNFLRPVPEVWGALLLAFPEQGVLQAIRLALAGAREALPDEATLMADAFFADFGPAWWLSWAGIDRYEILPAPLLLAWAETPNAAALAPVLEALPNAPTYAQGTLTPWYDATTRLAAIPLAGGPGIHPAFATANGGLLLGTSSTLAAAYQQGQANVHDAPQARGHLFVRAHPGPLASTLAETGEELAEFGLVRGHNRESFVAWASPWVQNLARVDELTALLAREQDTLQLRVTLTMAPPPAGVPSP